jgi:hypothetical protein
MRIAPLRTTLRHGLALSALGTRPLDRQLAVQLGIAAALVVTVLVGIWQKNEIDGRLLNIERLKHEVMIAEDAVAREEIAIAQLVDYDRIVPLAQKQLGLAVTPSDQKAYVAVPPEPRAPESRFDARTRELAVAARQLADWVLPGSAATAGE